ncbi:MAG TPA: response regulator [Geothrix sp.]|nr:response regulator [Geothrix sp.]
MGQRLLLVDSDRSFLKEHQVSLESAFDLEVTHSPDGVVARLETGAFAAVVICVEVAENKGYALCSTIRRQANLGDVKIILISAKASEEEYRRHQSLKGKADLYLHKPISPSTFVAALAPLVPGRTMDPDNPLGELVDTELGDDWLDSLKSSVEIPEPSPEPPTFHSKPDSPSRTQNLDVKATAPPDTTRTRLLEEQVAALHEELHAKDLRLQAAETELQQIQRQLNSVTLNLDDLERSNREAEALRTRLADTESALRTLEESKGREGESVETLQTQLREALEERAGLIQQVETLNQQVGEKAQRAIELLRERDRLMHENLDLQPYQARAKELEMLHAESLVAHEAAMTDKQAELERILESHVAATAAKQRELEEAEEGQRQLNASLETLVERYETLEGVHQSALLEIAGYKEKLHTTNLEMGGLEATLRGQGRDLAELGGKLGKAQAELEACQAQISEQEQQIRARQELLQQHQEEIVRLSGELSATRQELEEAKVQHEGERLELMHGLDGKEAELAKLQQALVAGQEAFALVEREKQSALGQLSEHRDRLQNLDGLLQEIQDKLRRGSDLARG